MLKRKKVEDRYMYDSKGRLISFSHIETEKLQGTPSELKELYVPKELNVTLTINRAAVGHIAGKCGCGQHARPPVSCSGKPKNKRRK